MSLIEEFPIGKYTVKTQLVGDSYYIYVNDVLEIEIVSQEYANGFIRGFGCAVRKEVE